MATKKPNILVLWGDDVGWWNISYNSRGQMGYRTPNIDRVANEGEMCIRDRSRSGCCSREAFRWRGRPPGACPATS